MKEKSKIIDTVREEKTEILKKRLKEQIDKIGYTQEKVARKVGISPSSISKYLNGNGFPDEITLEALANLFGVEPNYLVGKNICPTYSIEDISQKTGLSQNAIEKLYQLQHNYYLFEDNVKIDIEEKRKISNQYREHLDILNRIIENDVYLFWLLDSIKKYKSKRDEVFQQIEEKKKNHSSDLQIYMIDSNEELSTLESKIQLRFQSLIKEIIKS